MVLGDIKVTLYKRSNNCLSLVKEYILPVLNFSPEWLLHLKCTRQT